ncbi:restriction endonuclease subunit S [Marinobacter subterrani]|uniref:restriction endonuclease subunit S n=1 Tax=Marinobacter subterrani TaxID=1658765 RepID=UPI0023567268|nr:restriction endonuclease subunit S [Marinobacter subterrani]
MDGADTKYKTLNRVESNDIIVNKIWARNGSVSVVNETLAGCYCSGEFPLFRPNPDELDPLWFYWITKTRWFWTRCDEKSRGTSGKNRIKPHQFLEINIPLPPLDEQRRIVARIESLVLKIDEAKRLRQAIQIDARAMLRSAFQQVIEGSEYRAMGEVAPIVRRAVEIEPDGEYPELGVRSFGKGVFHKPTLIGAELDWQKLYRIHAGDLVISNIKAWEEAIAVADENDHNRVGSHRYITCVAEDGVITANFLCFYLLMDEGLQRVQVASPGSADRNRTLAMNRLKKIEVPVPDYGKQLWFNRLQTYVDTIAQAQADNQTELNALLPAILDQAFKGKL